MMGEIKFIDGSNAPVFLQFDGRGLEIMVMEEGKNYLLFWSDRVAN